MEDGKENFYSFVCPFYNKHFYYEIGCYVLNTVLQRKNVGIWIGHLRITLKNQIDLMKIE